MSVAINWYYTQLQTSRKSKIWNLENSFSSLMNVIWSFTLFSIFGCRPECFIFSVAIRCKIKFTDFLSSISIRLLPCVSFRATYIFWCFLEQQTFKPDQRLIEPFPFLPHIIYIAPHSMSHVSNLNTIYFEMRPHNTIGAIHDNFNTYLTILLIDPFS